MRIYVLSQITNDSRAEIRSTSAYENDLMIQIHKVFKRAEAERQRRAEKKRGRWRR